MMSMSEWCLCMGDMGIWCVSMMCVVCILIMSWLCLCVGCVGVSAVVVSKDCRRVVLGARRPGR